MLQKILAYQYRAEIWIFGIGLRKNELWLGKTHRQTSIPIKKKTKRVSYIHNIFTFLIFTWQIHENSALRHIFYIVAYIFLSRESDQSAITSLLKTCRPSCISHENGGIPLSVFFNDTTSKLAGLSSTFSLERQAGKL